MPRREWILKRHGVAMFIVAAVVVATAPQAAWALPALFTFSPASPLTGDVITFEATDRQATSTWDLDADGACDDAQGPSAQRTFRIGGKYPVTICVTDGTSRATQTQDVTVANRPPTAAFTFFPASPLTDDVVTFTSTSTDPEGPIASQAWDLDGDGQFDDAATPSATRPFAAPGSYSVGLRVVDADGAEHNVRQAVAILPRPPELLSPFPVVRLLGAVSSRGTRVRLLTVRAPAPARIEIGCRGRGCPARRRGVPAGRPAASVRVRRDGPVRFRRFERRLRAGTVLTVRVVMGPRTIGKYTRFRIRRTSPPARKDLCVMPAPRRLVQCP